MRPFDPVTGEFRPAAESLRRLAVRGAGVTVFAQGVAVAVQVVSTMVLARMLAPSDFGLVALVTTFSLLLMNFGVNGFTEAVIQREQIDRFLVSNLFWITVGIGILLTMCFAGAGTFLAWFFKEPLVKRVAVGISPSILFQSVSVLHLALLKRAMHFPSIAVNDIAARTLSVVVSTVLAASRCGYWALVAGAIALPLGTSVGAWVLCRWIPSPPRRAPGTMEAVRYALHVYGRFGIRYFARNLDNVLVGRYLSTQALGFYKKAYDLFALSASQLTGPLTAVAVSTLSRYTGNRPQFKRHFLSMLELVALVGIWLGAELSLVGRDVIRLLLGPGWEPAGRIFTWFGPGIGILLVYDAHGWIHLSIGRPDRWFRWSLLEFSFTAILFVAGLRWGPDGVAAAWTASLWILAIPAFRYAGQPIELGVGPVIAVAWKYVVASLVGACACVAILRAYPPFLTASGPAGALIRIVGDSLLFAPFYLGTIVALYGGFAPLHRAGELLTEILPPRWSARISWARTARPALTDS